MSLSQYSAKILIIEDEQSLLTALKDNFSAAGFGYVLEAEDGEKGLQIAQHEKPDLILLDIFVPKIDGIALLKMLKKEPRTEKIPVLILTNLEDDAKQAEVIENGAVAYLVKIEHTLEDVIEKVKAILKVS